MGGKIVGLADRKGAQSAPLYGDGEERWMKLGDVGSHEGDMSHLVNLFGDLVVRNALERSTSQGPLHIARKRSPISSEILSSLLV